MGNPRASAGLGEGLTAQAKDYASLWLAGIQNRQKRKEKDDADAERFRSSLKIDRTLYHPFEIKAREDAALQLINKFDQARRTNPHDAINILAPDVAKFVADSNEAQQRSTNDWNFQKQYEEYAKAGHDMPKNFKDAYDAMRSGDYAKYKATAEADPLGKIQAFGDTGASVAFPAGVNKAKVDAEILKDATLYAKPNLKPMMGANGKPMYSSVGQAAYQKFYTPYMTQAEADQAGANNSLQKTNVTALQHPDYMDATRTEAYNNGDLPSKKDWQSMKPEEQSQWLIDYNAPRLAGRAGVHGQTIEWGGKPDKPSSKTEKLSITTNENIPVPFGAPVSIKSTGESSYVSKNTGTTISQSEYDKLPPTGAGVVDKGKDFFKPQTNDEAFTPRKSYAITGGTVSVQTPSDGVIDLQTGKKSTAKGDREYKISHFYEVPMVDKNLILSDRTKKSVPNAPVTYQWFASGEEKSGTKGGEPVQKPRLIPMTAQMIENVKKKNVVIPQELADATVSNGKVVSGATTKHKNTVVVNGYLFDSDTHENLGKAK